jgi:6-phosphofructokinase 2
MKPILTLTLNPALDVSTQVERVQPVHKLRCSAELAHPGGGGINVARVAHRLGSSVLALYPSGGLNGQELQRLLHAEGIAQQPIPIAQQTRENFSVHESSTGQDYRFVLPGPCLSPQELEDCLSACVALVPQASLVVISGSLPTDVPHDTYRHLIERISKLDRRVVLDASGPALRSALQCGVQLVKPSLRELSELTGRTLKTPSEWTAAARACVRSGQAQVVALSLGEEGALVVTDHHLWTSPALPVMVRSTIGAGDSFLGGWLHGWQEHPELDLLHPQRIEQAFRWAMATAASSVSSLGTALCDAEQVRQWLPQVAIERF